MRMRGDISSNNRFSCIERNLRNKSRRPKRRMRRRKRNCRRKERQQNDMCFIRF